MNPETEQLSITKSEYHALNEVRGLASEAFHLVVNAKRTKSGRYFLEGSSKAFDELTNDLSDEIYHELSPPTRLKQIRKLYDRLSPDNDL